jgi:hypothetical protein
VSRKRSDEPHASTWLRHFGLTSVPFDKDIDDDELWLPESKQALVDDRRCQQPGGGASHQAVVHGTQSNPQSVTGTRQSSPSTKR